MIVYNKISLRRKLFSDTITTIYHTFILTGSFASFEWLMFMIYKVVLRRESLRVPTLDLVRS